MPGNHQTCMVVSFDKPVFLLSSTATEQFHFKRAHMKWPDRDLIRAEHPTSFIIPINTVISFSFYRVVVKAMGTSA